MRKNDPTSSNELKAVFEKRTAHYRRLGFDRLAAADFVVGSAGRLEGPALDVGTGKGTTAIALARLGVDVVSMDIEPGEQVLASMLAEEAGLRNSIRFVQHDASSMQFGDCEFGCVAAMDALHHFLDPLAVLGEMARVLRPLGKIILADFTAEGFDLISRVHREDGRDHPVLGVSLDVAERILSKAGMTVISRATGHMHEVTVLVKKTGGLT